MINVFFQVDLGVHLLLMQQQVRKHLQECVGQQELWNTKNISEPFTKHMVEMGLVQLTGACQLPVNDKLTSPLSFSL